MPIVSLWFSTWLSSQTQGFEHFFKVNFALWTSNLELGFSNSIFWFSNPGSESQVWMFGSRPENEKLNSMFTLIGPQTDSAKIAINAPPASIHCTHTTLLYAGDRNWKCLSLILTLLFFWFMQQFAWNSLSVLNHIDMIHIVYRQFRRLIIGRHQIEYK